MEVLKFKELSTEWERENRYSPRRVGTRKGIG